MEEFNLSDKIREIRETDFINGTRWISGIATKDVKELIKNFRNIIISNMTPRQKLKELDKITGEKFR